MRIKWVNYSILLSAFAVPCIAQTRWCSVSWKLSGDSLYYPPIARAASVTGTTIERITFTPNGSVLSVDPVLGHPLIAKPIATQLNKWSIKTNDQGNQPCQALVVVTFSFGDSESYAEAWTALSTVKVSIQAKPLVLYSLPAVSGN
jgi:hypothetical protein